ncbi:MAG: SIMPL domain-containing protein [Pseudomonadota bacterium]
MTFQNVLAGLCVGVGIALAGFFVSQTTLNERIGANTATVKGLSERIVTADKAAWRFGYQVAGRGDVAADFARADEDGERIRQVLTEAGFTAAELTFAPLIKSDEVRYNNNGEVIDRYHVVRGEVSVSTTSPGKVAPARGPIFELAIDGVSVDEYFISYQFTGLNEIKPDMLREATANARVAANEFAANAGVTVGGIQTATQGGFQIRAANEGVSEADAIEKLVRVVTTITFYLNN